MPQNIELQHDVSTDALKEYFRCSGSRSVSWAVNGDGTATSITDRLMWMQAPWGMTLAGGNNFWGEPKRLSWLDAARLFGRGTPVGLSESGTIALSSRQISSTAFGAGYTRGEERFKFAGHDDWRLPTVAEWHSVIGLEYEKREMVFPYSRADERYWSATMRKEVFGEGEEGFFLRTYLSWTSEKKRLAWAANFGRWIIDCGVLEQYPVMLARSI